MTYKNICYQQLNTIYYLQWLNNMYYNMLVQFHIYRKIIDISVTVEKGMIIYPGLREFEMKRVKDYSLGDPFALSEVYMSLHTGTHMDSPYHFVNGGKKVNEISLDVFCGPARVFKVPAHKDKIDVEYLRTLGPLPERILFKTRNSELYKRGLFVKDYVYIDPEAAKYIASFHVKLVGIDYVSIEKYSSVEKPEYDAHRELLSKDIVILENIILSEVMGGNYQLICFPLKIDNAEASPCRAVLIVP